MRQIIRYITGFPLKETPKVKTLDEAIAKYPLSQEAQEVWAKENDKRVPVSFYAKYGKSRKDLTDKSQILVFMEGNLVGNVRFRNRSLYNDQWAGYTEQGSIVANVLDQEASEKWTFWNNSPIRWIADRIIREEVLEESMKGISYKKRLKEYYNKV